MFKRIVAASGEGDLQIALVGCLEQREAQQKLKWLNQQCLNVNSRNKRRPTNNNKGTAA